LDVCVVVNEERVVLGLLRDEQLAQDGDKVVAEVMRPGPSTFRPHLSVEEIAHYMIDHDLPSSPITTSDGRLVGLLMADDAVRVVHERHVHHAPQEEAS
jgi:Mg/Co/Ni transporter MgtE